MLDVAARPTELAFYAAHGASLFPIPAGQKHGHLVPSFKHDHSSDPAQWAAWSREFPGCNFGVVAFASQWIICDPDADKIGRDAAWQAWANICAEWGIPTAAPQVQSARGGWHIYFKVPPHIDASTLRQPDALKGIINIRCVGYTVAAGSTFEGKPYLLFPDAPPPHPAPQALLDHCTRAAPRQLSNFVTGYRDKSDIAALLTWMVNHGAFESYEDWCAAGMALRVEYSDDGAELWALCHDSSVTPEVAESKWNSFATEPKAGCVTLASIMKRAHALGWKGSIRPSASHLFSEVAQLAAASGATLRGAVPIMGGRGAAHLKLFSSILAAVPIVPRSGEHPTLPDIGHPLQNAINAAIPGIMAAPSEHVTAHAVINLIHSATAATVWPITPAVSARTAFLEAEESQVLAPNEYAKDERGRIQSDNRDNVEFYLNSLGVSCRWNDWLEQPEVQGWTWPRWTRVNDTILAILRMNATKTGTRFVMGKEFAADALLTLAQHHKVDPARDLLDKWQAEWDGTPRMEHWLSRACGVPDNVYYRAVARTVLLGLVGRIRHPGIKFDLMMVLISEKQGTEKSSLAKTLALNNEWFVDNVSLGQESKELVLLLAGKTVGEVKEMRSRGDVEAAKAMIDTTHDEGRTAYARFTTKRARRNILIGSTNKPEFLEDPSGARRFLPVHVVGRIDLEWVKETLPQLIGEAAAALAEEVEKHNFEKIELPRDVWDIAAEYQEAARAQSDFEIHMAAWFFGEGPGWIAANDLLGILRDATGRSVAPNQYGAAMRKLGFETKVVHNKGRVWYRGTGGQQYLVDRMKGSVKQMFAGAVRAAS